MPRDDDEHKPRRSGAAMPVFGEGEAAAQQMRDEIARLGAMRPELINDDNMRALVVFTQAVSEYLVKPVLASEDAADRRKHDSMASSLQYTDRELARRHSRAIFELVPTVVAAFLIILVGASTIFFVEGMTAAGIALVFAGVQTLRQVKPNTSKSRKAEPGADD